ncbi:amidohydrolase family protein [bacterium]|nr:amidohydrolase family protein [bacterium]
MTEKLLQWLAQVQEPILEPELPICDAHHHLWDYPGGRYLLYEILNDINSGHNIRSTVFMECGSMYRADGPAAMKPVGETEFVQGIAAMSASGQYGESRVAAGIIGYADLQLGAEVAAVLEAHMAASPNRFRGIRHASGWDADKHVRNSHTNPPRGLLLDPTFQKGFAQLERFNLTFDAWLYHPQISELTQLARKFPNTTIILDHFGGPLGIGPYQGKRQEIFPEWKKAIRELAACPNVMAKLGGLAMAVNGFDWHKRETPPTSVELAEAQKPYHLHCLDLFGIERCLFESNFPVDRVSCSYAVLWNACKRIAATCSADEKRALFHDNAVRVYRLQ